MAENGKKKPEPNLVEVASILFIVAILFSVVQPGVGMIREKALKRANLVKCQQNIMKLKDAIEAYRKANEGRFPRTLQAMVKEGSLDMMPKCPSQGKRGYDDDGYFFRPGDPGRFTILCRGEVHSETDAGKDEPVYDSLYGLKPPLGPSASAPSPSLSPSPSASP